ncbi:hypothetical protein UFOVP1469_23 [uncultured Caudovirales phage]|uniref:Uncharacterized protein n=1 Tax=uncultured Caudovirales phage TaxID=2100421 RepID=A0A6J5SM13_9CAUD|nr:hypothetical protein UFOVP1469_23 [uncultured Caudovirales phage]CAB5229301.1 hypothetical protein UFOVP1556_29 [uncultured Caudovirales phage]
MARPKGIPKTGGRKAGVGNKTTVDVRNAIALIAQDNAGNFAQWLGEVALEDPGKAADLYLKAIEYHIPKLARSEVSGPNGGPQVVEATWRITE